MALRTGSEPGIEEWEELLIEIGISTSSASTYAEAFSEEKLTKDSLPMMDRAMLKELGVTAMGDALAILKFAKGQTAASTGTYAKAPAVKLPQLSLEMTSQQFRKFNGDACYMRNPMELCILR